MYGATMKAESEKSGEIVLYYGSGRDGSFGGTSSVIIQVKEKSTGTYTLTYDFNGGNIHGEDTWSKRLRTGLSLYFGRVRATMRRSRKGELDGKGWRWRSSAGPLTEARKSYDLRGRPSTAGHRHYGDDQRQHSPSTPSGAMMKIKTAWPTSTRSSSPPPTSPSTRRPGMGYGGVTDAEPQSRCWW